MPVPTMGAAMAIVTELELPEFDYLADDLTGEVYHQRLAAVRSQGWLASSPLSYVVLDREAGEFFLRSKGTAFPGREIADLFGVTGGRLREQIDANIINLTGDRHRRVRALVGPAFSPRAADAWRPVMRGYLQRLWAGIEPATSAEFVEALAKPYPSLTITAVLGAPEADAPRLHDWSHWVQRQFDVRALANELPRIERATAELYDYVETLLEQRRAVPAGDLLEHRGVVFPPGTIVAVCAERANREQAGDEPGPAADGDAAGERFDITVSREDRLLTFGAGPHFCLGANLARAELEEALAFLVPRMPGLAPDGPAELGGVEGIYGVVSLPLRWSAG